MGHGGCASLLCVLPRRPCAPLRYRNNLPMATARAHPSMRLLLPVRYARRLPAAAAAYASLARGAGRHARPWPQNRGARRSDRVVRVQFRRGIWPPRSRQKAPQISARVAWSVLGSIALPFPVVSMAFDQIPEVTRAGARLLKNSRFGLVYHGDDRSRKKPAPGSIIAPAILHATRYRRVPAAGQ